MNNIIYNEMIDSKIAKKLEDAIFMDCDGKVVDESKCFGKKVDVEMSSLTIASLEMRLDAILP